MTDDIQRQLLSALLDKYERSGFFRDKTRPRRKITLKLYDDGRCEFPQYDIEQSEKRISVNRAVLAISEKGLISHKWMRGEEDHIMAKVWLNLEALPMAYDFIGRKPKSDAIDDICLEISEISEKVNAEWAKRYFRDLFYMIARKRDVGKRLPEDKNEREELFRAIMFIDNMGDRELLERVFSLQCFGESKKFEKTVKSRLLSILRKYLDSSDDVNDEDLLKQLGIVKYPEQFEFCGDAAMSFENGAADFSRLRYGCSIYPGDLVHGDFIVSAKTDRVLSIENRANYIDYIYNRKAENELVIYHGGQYSPSKKIFLRAAANAVSDECRWFHWGDIDYGGFSMLARLRREIKDDVIPYRMDEGELVKYDDLTGRITHSYREKLKNLMTVPELKDCSECLRYMIKHGKRLEQEAMLTDQSDQS